MAGINVNQLTSMLSKLQPDSALQNYAQMHKNDPYIVSLAASESNRRKELRAAGQAAAAGQPQPKVADAAIAQMAPQQLPEDVGIGQLRAPNLQFAAEGGIMGYDGYDEGGMTYGQEPVTMMAGGGVARYQAGGAAQDLLRTTTGGKSWFLDVPQTMRDPSVPYYREITSPFAPLADKEFATKDEALAAYNQIAPAAAPSAKKVTPTFSPDDYSGTDRRIMSGSMPNIPSITPPAKPAPTERRVAAPRPGAGPAAAAAPEQSAAARYAAMQKEMGMGPEAGADLAWQRSQLAERMRAQSKGEMEEFEKDVATRGEAFKGREERLAKREAGLGRQKDETAGLALLEAGLAIMSTPGKLAEAVGKGAQAGLKTYGAGLEKLRAAQEKMDDARDQIEEFRRNEATMTAKERRQFKSAINRTETDIEKMAVDAAKDMYGYRREDTKAVFSASEQSRNLDKEIAGRENAARIAAGPAYERNKLLKDAQGNEAKVRAEYGKLQAKVMDTLSKDANYQMANPAMQSTMYTNALRQAVSTNPFLASYASGIGFSSAPTGKVYDLTED